MPGLRRPGRLTHARLTEGPYSIETLLRLPKGLQPDRYVVQCEALVGRKGRTHRFTCYSAQERQRALIGAVRAAGRQAKFVPATRAGVTVDVYMLIMVQIDTTQREPLILAVPNNGVEAARYGLLYSAPQRFNEFTWSAETWGRRSGRVLLWQKMQIDEEGKVLECVVTNPSGGSRSSRQKNRRASEANGVHARLFRGQAGFDVEHRARVRLGNQGFR